ncbi:hypothetical protein LCGC14_2543420 [marine sediment metagenome]|uniref:30S ribosomal protein S21 n=1 Tax=marine sediment metagenome TaxID=412755 RepID=A0A0F9DI28_9ZZZZ
MIWACMGETPRGQRSLIKKGGGCKLLEVKVNGNDVEKALKVLKRRIQKEGLLGELKKRRFFEKPSVKLRRKQREAEKRRLKRARRKRR